MKVKVKICGIRDLESAEVAVDTGADFLGFNFVPKSKRCIDPEKAKKIIDTIGKKVRTIGVFQNTPIDEVNNVADALNLDFVQLHGEENEDYIKNIRRKIIKKYDLELNSKMNENISYLLIDRKIQGKGEMVDLNIAKNIAKKHKIFFSGGLTPENVLYVIKKIKPFAVDVAGGIETNGKQDLKKIKMFIKNVKKVNL